MLKYSLELRTLCKRGPILAVWVLLVIWVASTGAADPAGTDAARLVREKIAPVLEAECYRCHTAKAEKLQAGLRLDSRAGLLEGGDFGPAVVPGKSEESPLIHAIRHRFQAHMAATEEHNISPGSAADQRAWKPKRQRLGKEIKRCNAFKTQTEAREVLDLSREPRQTLDLYGIGVEPTHDYGRRCLLARKLVENGLRFVCVASGGGPGNQQWDAHDDIEENHVRKAAETGKPVAGLLMVLKRRGLLESTLVFWGGEFGRSPEAQAGHRRDHHNLGFTMWMAGGGVNVGQTVGATDAIGLRATESPYHFRDIHTIILHRPGLDQNRLTYPHLGRNERLTFVEGKVIRPIV